MVSVPDAADLFPFPNHAREYAVKSSFECVQAQGVQVCLPLARVGDFNLET